MFFVFLALTVLAVLTLDVGKWRGASGLFYTYQLLKVIVVAVLSFFLLYVQLIDLSFQSWFAHYAWLIILIWIGEYFISTKKGTFISTIQLIVALLSVLFLIYVSTIYPITIANDKFKVVEGKKENNLLPQTDDQNIVSVPLVYAQYKAEKLMGELENSSYYELGEYTIQNIDGELMYVSPIEFSEFSTWRRSGKEVPGYIEVSAVDENKPAKLVKEKMKYTPSSYFGNNLYRKARQAAPTSILLGVSFEPKDNGKPYYIITYGHYTQFRKIQKVDGVMVMDPLTGDIQKYTNKNIPSFIDQSIPADTIASPYNHWYGRYERGWLNSVWGKKGLKLPTSWGLDSDVSPVYNNKGEMSWFTDFTTINKNASSMIGYSMMNARTGELVFYYGNQANGLINGDAAKKVVDKTFTKDKWEGVQPMLYNIYGEMTWFLPVVDGDGLLRSYALVNAKDPKVLAVSDTKSKVFERYKSLIVNKLGAQNVKPGTGLDMKTVKGKILSKEVVSKEDDTFVYLRLDSKLNKIYRASMSKTPFSIVLEKGENVEIKYVDTKEAIAEVQDLQEMQDK